MKRILVAFIALTVILLPAANRKTEISGPVRDVGEIRIVTDTATPVVRYAAQELQKFLKQSTGKEITIGTTADPDRFNLILGDGPEAGKAGLDCRTLPDEGYYIRRIGNRLYIAGNDSADQDPAASRWHTAYRRATLSGVYDFLERFTGARFFFPGKYGTVVPKKGGLFLPEKIDVMESPDMVIRSLYYGSACKSYDPAIPLMEIHKALHFRLRLSEKSIYCGHGLNFLELINRFGKTHPEYFALRDDGKRYNDPSMPAPGQLCFTSGVCEEIYQDVKAYFSGKPASSRGLSHWNRQMVSDGVFCVMPQDGMYWCRCENCRKIAKPEDVYTPAGRQAISNHMFRWTAQMAERLTKEGIKGSLIQMVYLPYDAIPDCRIPENVWIQIAVNGTISDGPDLRKPRQRIPDWNRKTGAKVSIWTYAMGKHMTKSIPGIPAMMPKETAKFLQTYRNELNGAFYESETDQYIFNYLNYYVLAKVLWNSSLNTEELLDDHYKVMFGQGAPFVRQVFEEMEECWVRRFISNTVMGELGPRVQIPGDQQIWCDIYSPERLAKWEKLFDSAQKAASGEAAERVAFIREKLLGPLKEQQSKFQSAQGSLDSWKVYVPGTVHLRPYTGEVNEVNSKITLSMEGDFLVLRGTFEEPRMQDLLAKAVKNDDPNTWADSVMEFFINPSGDRKHYYHFVVNANGAVTDYSQELHKSGDITWNSGATGKGVKEANGWKVELRIPLKSLGKLAKEVPVNFARHRALNGKQPAEIYYQWSPQPGARTGGFGATEKWGTMIFGKAPEKLIPFGDFSEDSPTTGWRGKWPDGTPGQKAEFDNRIFISGGRSLYFRNAAGGRMSGGFNIPGMKPGKKYRLSYYIRTNDIHGRDGAGAYIHFCKGHQGGFPATRISGTHPWHRLTFEIKTPPETGKDMAPILGLWMWFAEGEVWYDKVELKEIQ